MTWIGRIPILKSLINPNNSVLARIKIFTIKDLWLFLLGILFISMTSGAIAAFMLGVRDEEFFIREADNILIVTQPGITTPFTGQVPESMQEDIQKIRGVISISPETLGLSIAQNLNEKSVVVRGITTNFTQLTPTQVIAGSWFNPIYDQANDTQINNTQVNGAMIGYLLASNLGLDCGDKIQLASTLTDMVVEVAITGIIRSNSPCDEEILVSLALGKAIAGKEFSFVSLLRVLIDKDIISKETLSNIINTEYKVPISLNSQDPKLAGIIVGTPVVVYTPYGEHVETKLIESGNKTEFELKFGTYEFVATPPEAQSSSPLKVFVNQSFNTAFEITIGGKNYDLQLNITYHKLPAYNASVLLKKRFKPEEYHTSNTTEEGLVQFLNIQENYYKININYKKIFKQISIKLNRSMQVNIELECSLALTTLNISSGLEIQGGIVKILKKKDLIEVYYNDSYQSGTPIYLDHGYYQVEFQYNNILRKFSTVVNRSVSETIYVGTASLSIWARGENEQGLDSTNVTIVRYDGSILQNFTESNGKYEFHPEVGLDYTLTVIPAKNQSKVYKQTIFFENSSSLIIDFLDSYFLDIIALNGTLNNTSSTALSGCNIAVFKESNMVASGVTNSSGQITFNLSEPGIYNVFAKKNGFNWSRNIIIRSRYINCKIRLGKVRLLISAQSVTGYPVSGVFFSVETETEDYYTGTTNSSGLVEIIFPIGEYELDTSKEGFFSEENISFVESQYASIIRTIELSGTLSISLTNQFYQKISQAYIVLTNEYYNFEYMGFTNPNGECVFYEIPWGNYSVQITYREEIFPRDIIDFAGNKVNFEIQIEMSNPFVDLNDYTYRRGMSAFSIVVSSEYVSGFLQTTLNIFITAFTSLVIIISGLSLLSITSVISHPIVSNAKSIRTFQYLGATRHQVIFGVVVQLSLLGVMASVLGAYSGMWIMTIFPTLRNVNIGGVIIRPKLDIWLFLLIVLSNLGVVILKSAQKAHEIYKLR